MNDFIKSVTQLIRGIRTLAIPRIEDLPYWSSPPIQFVYESTASLALGTYIWNDAPGALSPNRPILENALYFFRSITMTADIEGLDFQAALVTSPQFYTFLESDQDAVLFREPIIMNQFFQQFRYRLTWARQRSNDQLKAAFRGTLVQTPALIGKANITLKAVISAQEIVDDNYIEAFKAAYPEICDSAKAVNP